jgi:hypothetical protein
VAFSSHRASYCRPAGCKSGRKCREKHHQPPSAPAENQARQAADLADRLLKGVVMSETKSKPILTERRWRQAILISVMSAGLAFVPWAQGSQSVTLAWDASRDTNVAGYVIRFGPDSVSVNNQLDAGTNTSITVSGLQEGTTNYFVVTAYDINHNESPPSSPTYYYVPGVVQMGPMNHAIAGMRPVVPAIQFPVAPGHTYSVQASTDLKNWRTIWETTSTSNAWVQFQDPASANLQMRFYRTVSN